MAKNKFTLLMELRDLIETYRIFNEFDVDDIPDLDSILQITSQDIQKRIEKLKEF